MDYLNRVFNTFFVLFALPAPALCPAIRHGQAATKSDEDIANAAMQDIYTNVTSARESHGGITT